MLESLIIKFANKYQTWGICNRLQFFE